MISASQTDVDSGNSATYQQAKVANAMIKVQKNKVQLDQLQKNFIDHQQARTHIQQLVQAERQSWLDWCPVVIDECAQLLSVDQHALTEQLRCGINEHFNELGDINPSLG